MAHWTDLFSFVTGAIRRKDLGYLVLSFDSAAAKHIPQSGFVQWKPAGWADGGECPWLTAGVAVVRSPVEQLIAVGEFGGVLLVGSGDRHEEVIEVGGRSVAERGPLRGVRLVGECVYVVGADSQVYRREGAHQWRAWDEGLPGGVRFEAVDGFGEADLVAVGWDGAVWRCVDGVWGSVVSPTDAVLVDVCCAGDGRVFACGRQGLLVCGVGDEWSVLDVAGFSDDLWSVAWYGGELYVATMSEVLRLGAAGLEVVDMGEDRAGSCYDLVTGDGVMWSVGAKDVMAFDGTTWSRID